MQENQDDHQKAGGCMHLTFGAKIISIYTNKTNVNPNSSGKLNSLRQITMLTNKHMIECLTDN